MRWLAAKVVTFGQEVTNFWTVLARSARVLPRVRAADYWEQLWRVALSAVLLVGVAALFAGIIIAYQASFQAARIGQPQIVADGVSFLVVRELAPIFTAIVMAGKAGAGLASELGMVTLSGQAQAMRAMSIDIDRELVAPRVWACVTGTVLLTIAAIFMGLIGGMLISSGLGLSASHFLNRAVGALEPFDFALSLLKAGGFGFIIAGLGCSFGLKPKADAAALGNHTMTAVVAALFCVLVSDQIFNSLITAVLV